MIQHFGHRAWSEMTAFGKSLVKIYAGVGTALKLIWEKIRSCYGTGVWREERPWLDNDTWKDN